MTLESKGKPTTPRKLLPNVPPPVYEPMEGPKLRPLKGPRRPPVDDPFPAPPPKWMPEPPPKPAAIQPPKATAPPPPIVAPAQPAASKTAAARAVHLADALPRVVVFTRDDPRRSTGGVETFSQRLLEVFPRSEVVAYGGAAGRRLFANEARDAFAARGELARAVTLLRPAAIVANGAAAWALREANVPIVAVYHGTYAGLGEAIAPIAPRRGFIARTYGAFMERRATRGRAAIVAVSRKAAEEVRALYGVRASVRVIENGGKPDLRPLPPKMESRRELGISETARVALYVGRAEATKGFGEVVALAQARPDVTVVAAGVAPDGGLPENLLAKGVVGADVMARLLAAADVVVLPSRYEGCSFALIDAAMSDRPIVATATGCFDTVGEHPFGIVVPLARDRILAADFIEAVDSVLAAPQRFKPVAACRERFSFARFARDWRALIREISQHGT